MRCWVGNFFSSPIKWHFALSKKNWFLQERFLFLVAENKNHGLPSLNAIMPAMNSINEKAVMNMMPNFDDPVEQSLASLEQLACKLIPSFGI